MREESLNGSDRVGNQIVILDLGNGRKRYLDDFPTRTLYFYAGRGQGLRRFHALHDTPDPLTIYRDDLDVVFAVKRLQGRQGFSYFHV